MDKIGNIFRANSDSVKDTFLHMGGSAGFRIPIYQRAYAWRDENIKRLFEDMAHGLRSLGDSTDTVTFLGTIILVEEHRRSEPSFDGASFSVVDGQQRLTTICLAACVLARKIDQIQAQLEEEWPEGEFGVWLKNESSLVAGELQACMVNTPGGFGKPEAYQLIPRLVREDVDSRGRTLSEARYVSPVAKYIFSLARYFLDSTGADFEFNVDDLGESGKELFERLSLIEKEIEQFEDGSAFEANDLPEISSFLSLENYRGALFPKAVTLGESFRRVNQECNNCEDDNILRLLRLITVGNYLLHRLAITRVEADNEDYAFDIFDALNTTGEPLTAIETFKPLVIRREQTDTDGGYSRSESCEYFNKIELQVENFPSNDARQRESRQVITLLALYAQGKKVSESLNAQRSYLRRAYDQEAVGANGRRRLVRAFFDVAEYRRRLWSRDQLPNELRDLGEKRSEVLFCLDFIRDLGNSLTIPILTRYLYEAERSGDLTIFADIVLAVTAFLVLRRGATGVTQGIDDDYRNLMRKGRPGQGNWTPLKLGLERDITELPSVDEFKSYLRSYLSQRRIEIENKNDWVIRFSQQPHFKTGKTSLCKFFLLTAAHNAVVDSENKHLLKKIDRHDPMLEYRTLDQWRNPNFASTEHIAPQSRHPNWTNEIYEDIYQDVNAINTVGNLTLLPREENSAAGNSSWSRKKLFYGACLTRTRDETEEYFREAERQGADFGLSTRNMIAQGNCLPLLSGVANVEEWDLEIIRERGENIGSLIWDDLAPWIGL